MTSDVIVVGAGIIGCAVAYEAARRGLSVTVLERGEPGSGASGVGGGFISLTTKKPGPHRALARDSARLYATLEAELDAPPGSLGYRRDGSLTFAETVADLPLLDDLHARGRESGLCFQRLGPAELRRIEPGLSDRLPGALYCTDDGEVFPMRVLEAYRRAAERLGARFEGHVEVSGANRKGDTWEVRTGRGIYGADRIVIAAGAWSGEGGRLFGVSVPVKPRRGAALLFPLPERIVRHPMLSAGYTRAKHGDETASDPLSLSLWQRPDRTVFAGGTREWAGFDTIPDPSALDDLHRRASAVLPALTDAPPPRPVVGFRPYSETGLPLIGPAAGQPGLFLAAGHEGDGISLATITGRLLGQCLAGETPDLDPTPFQLPVG